MVSYCLGGCAVAFVFAGRIQQFIFVPLYEVLKSTQPAGTCQLKILASS